MIWPFGKKFENETHKELYEKIEQFSAKWNKDLKQAGVSSGYYYGGKVQSVGPDSLGGDVLVRWVSGTKKFYRGKGWLSSEFGPMPPTRLKPDRFFNNALTVANVLEIINTSIEKAIKDKKAREKFESDVLEKVDNIL